MSYHFAFLSPRFNLAFLATDTRITAYRGATRRVTDGVRKITQITDFVWVSCVGFLPLGEAYTKWLTEIWNLDVQAAKAPSIFLRDPNFQTRSREFCQNEFAALKDECRRSGVPSIREIVHMILIGATDRDEPFFIAVNHGGNESFVHTFVSVNDGELPFVHPLEEQRVLNWVQQGIGAIQMHQTNAANRTKFIKSAQIISTQIFKEISALMSNVSASCDLLVITAEKSALSRGESKRPITVS